MKLKIDSWMGSLGVASAAGLLALGVACSRDANPVSVPVEERSVVSVASSPEGASLEEQVLNVYGSPSPEVYATPVSTPMATPTYTSSPTSTSTPTPTPTPTLTPTPSPTPSHTATPPHTSTSTPSSTPPPTLTPTPEPTLTYTPTSIPSPTLTPTPTSTPALTPTAIPTQTYTPTSTPVPVLLSYVEWVVDGHQMSLDVLDDLKHGVQLMHDYAVSLGMPEIEKTITFHVDYGPHLQYTGIYYFDSVFLNSARFDSANFRILAASHELNHAQMDALSDLSMNTDDYDEVPGTGPEWLTEGVAEFLSYQALSEGDVMSYDAIRGNILLKGSYLSASGSLAEMGTSEDFEPFGLSGYRYSMLAVEFLASLAGQSSLIDYYESLEEGTTWQEGFKNTFGMNVNDFYERFEEHEANGFPRLETPKHVGLE